MEGQAGFAPEGIAVPADGAGFDEAAFRLMYPALHRFASVVADRGVDPDDLVQDALVGLLRAPPGHVRDPGAYLRRSVLNAVAGGRRRSAVRRVTPVDPGAPLSERCESLVDDLTRPSDARAVMDAVRPADRALLYLLDVEDLPAPAVAGILGLSAVAVRARASRARRAARRALQRMEDGS
jgi:DNA-directed RNA polymerase specialized sigma24 family protein